MKSLNWAGSRQPRSRAMGSLPERGGGRECYMWHS
jgi:hypothetical protein